MFFSKIIYLRFLFNGIPTSYICFVLGSQCLLDHCHVSGTRQVHLILMQSLRDTHKYYLVLQMGKTKGRLFTLICLIPRSMIFIPEVTGLTEEHTKVIDVRKMQIKTTLRHFHTLIRITTFKHQAPRMEEYGETESLMQHCWG